MPDAEYMTPACPNCERTSPLVNAALEVYRCGSGELERFVTAYRALLAAAAVLESVQ